MICPYCEKELKFVKSITKLSNNTERFIKMRCDPCDRLFDIAEETIIKRNPTITVTTIERLLTGYTT